MHFRAVKDRPLQPVKSTQATCSAYVATSHVGVRRDHQDVDAPVITDFKNATMAIRNLGRPPDGWKIYLADGNKRKSQAEIYFVCVNYLNLRFGKTPELCEADNTRLLTVEDDQHLVASVNGVLRALKAAEETYATTIDDSEVVSSFKQLAKASCRESRSASKPQHISPPEAKRRQLHDRIRLHPA